MDRLIQHSPIFLQGEEIYRPKQKSGIKKTLPLGWVNFVGRSLVHFY
jgi:hypothetical protein